MKKNRIMMTLLAVSLSIGMMSSKEKAKHVIFIGLDGWGSYSVEKADMPNVKKLMREGSYTLKNRTVLPSHSAANWGSMFMGSSPELHGFYECCSKTPDLTPRTTPKNNIYPTIFQLLREKKPKAEIGCIYDWSGIKHLIDTFSVSYHEQAPDFVKFPGKLCDMAEKYIKERKPTFAAIIFDEPDHTGHADGHDTPGYYQKLKELDGYVGRIVKAVEDAGMTKEAIFIVVADHGGINKGHGGRTMKEMEVPFIISGKNVKKGHTFNHLVTMQCDIGSTIAYIFDIKQPQAWRGFPVKEAFQ